MLFAPGSQFHHDGRPSRGLRLSFAMADEAAIRARGRARSAGVVRERRLRAPAARPAASVQHLRSGPDRRERLAQEEAMQDEQPKQAGNGNGGGRTAAEAFELKVGLAEMLKGGVIMDVTTPEQAKIAEDAGAAAVMALERVPADIRREGGVARMARSR